MVEPIWDGVTRVETLKTEAAAVRHNLADRARTADWPAVLATLDRHPELINCTRPGGRAWYTVLHQAGYTGAPAEVVERLLALGAWRTLRTRDGARAVDLARRRGHRGRVMPDESGACVDGADHPEVGRRLISPHVRSPMPPARLSLPASR